MKKILFLAAVAAMFFSSCQKGDKGDPGTNGNANVQGYTLTVYPNNWINVGTNTYSTGYISATGITQDIFNNGLVSAYVSIAGSWFALPYIYEPAHIDFNFKTNQIAFTLVGFTAPTDNINFRFVTATIHARLANPHQNWTDYFSTAKLIEHFEPVAD